MRDREIRECSVDGVSAPVLSLTLSLSSSVRACRNVFVGRQRSGRNRVSVRERRRRSTACPPGEAADVRSAQRRVSPCLNPFFVRFTKTRACAHAPTHAKHPHNSLQTPPPLPGTTAAVHPGPAQSTISKKRKEKKNKFQKKRPSPPGIEPGSRR